MDTHPLAFSCLLARESFLKAAMSLLRNKLIEAQIGAASGKDARKCRADAESHIATMEDTRFWQIPGTVKKDFEPIPFITNIMQADVARADQVVRGLAGIWLHFTNYPNPTMRDNMTAKLEHR